MTACRKHCFAVRIVGAALLSLAFTTRATASETCTPSEGRIAQLITGEISGSHEFREPLSNGWTFALVPDPFGWHIRLLDASGLDLTQMTPPYRGAPNPREIFGWHFRNEGNTASNEGSVNAPQHLRLFLISPSLIGTGGFKPSADTADPQPSRDDGRGSLKITDFGLADLEPGQKARMVYLKFEACLSWPGTEAVTTILATISDDVVARIRACGLDETFTPSSHLRPPAMEGDLDGDGTLDLIVPVSRAADSKRALAICRAGNQLNLIGLTEKVGQLDPVYFDRMDTWALVPKGPVNQGVAEGAPPTLQGDAILLGMEEKSSVLVYWDGSRFSSYWQGD